MPIQIYLCLKYLHLKPVVVKLSSISSSKLLCEASSPLAMFVTTCMGLVKTIGNVAFPLSSVIPHCYIPTASQHAPPPARNEKPVLVMSLAHTQLTLSQVHTTLTNDLNEIGNVMSESPLPYPHCYARPNSRISIFDVLPEPLYTWHSDEDGLPTRLFILPLLPEIGFVVANKTFDIFTG